MDHPTHPAAQSQTAQPPPSNPPFRQISCYRPARITHAHQPDSGEMASNTPRGHPHRRGVRLNALRCAATVQPIPPDAGTGHSPQMDRECPGKPGTTPPKAPHMEPWNPARRAELLASVPLFAPLPRTIITELAALFRPKPVPRGAFIFHE